MIAIVKKNAMLLILLIVILLSQLLISINGSGSLFSPSNVTNFINQNSYVFILATGMLLCIITGGNIDLSVGSVVAFISAVSGVLMVRQGMNIYLTIAICLILGVLIGAWQGFWIAYMRIPPFIVTLAGMLYWRGLAQVLLGGMTISPFPPKFVSLTASYLPFAQDKETIFRFTLLCGIFIFLMVTGISILKRHWATKAQQEIVPLAIFLLRLAILGFVIISISFLLGQHNGFPVVLILLGTIILGYSYLTKHTVFGRHLYAIGGNEKAARLSGINTNKALFLAYTNMSFLAAIAALVCVARFNSAAPAAGINYELDAIASCFIGGASAYGGTGTVGGAVIGAMFMGVMNNAMSILGVDADWQRVFKGLVLLLAVVFDVLSKRRRQGTSA